jgi:uncharacterized protein (TIGR02757 family)
LKSRLKFEELKEFLDEKVEKYNRPHFIEEDPIQIPHRFEEKEDVEIAGFLASTIAWGKRVMIIKNAARIMELMDHAPHDFVRNHSEDDLNAFDGFVHRTFNAEDLKYFMRKLQQIYQEEGLEQLFVPKEDEINLKGAFERFHHRFFEGKETNFRTRKHIANPGKGSSAKRLTMYLRWMARPGNTGVDFGIWNQVPLSKLSCPLDVHTGNVGRSLGFITRKANDWKSVEELDTHLRKLDPEDPAKYDFALFGLGVDEGWK